MVMIMIMVMTIIITVTKMIMIMIIIMTMITIKHHYRKHKYTGALIKQVAIGIRLQPRMISAPIRCEFVGMTMLRSS